MQIYMKYMKPRLGKVSLACAEWCHRHLRVRCRILAVCVLTGLLAGAGAWILKCLIRWVSVALTSGLTEGGINWVLFVAPALALPLAGRIQRSLFHRDVSRGTEKLKRDLKAKDYDLPHQLAYQPVLGCAVTVGMGGSAGAEGPIAYAGAAIGSNAAKFFRLPPGFTRLMLGFGAAAGIAAIFKAPLAGMFFTLEVLGMTLTTAPVLGLATCCLIAAFTSYLLSGMTPDVVWQGAITTFDYSQFWWLPVIGLIMGLYCRWYRASGMFARARWLRVSTPWKRELAAGVFLGTLIVCMPTLFGEGYGALQKVLAGDLARLTDFSPLWADAGTWAVPVMLCGILLFKGAAVYTTNNAGGVSGSFAPTLFIGCMAGALMALGADAAGCSLPHSQIAYVCMAAAMAGIVRAPLMATFITVEVTMTYSLLLPVCTVAFISYAVAALHIPRPRGRRHAPGS